MITTNSIPAASPVPEASSAHTDDDPADPVVYCPHVPSPPVLMDLRETPAADISEKAAEVVPETPCIDGHGRLDGESGDLLLSFHEDLNEDTPHGPATGTAHSMMDLVMTPTALFLPEHPETPSPPPPRLDWPVNHIW
ncbi:hypothetical protein JVU11DRAFT_10769 [Chiua virens]|nr:hypothetical protein JVU11DRAFT_10769 [Chiua virens]